jgi:hypothetical protein
MSVAANYYLRGIRVSTKVHKGETLKVKEISLEKLNVNAIIFEQTSVENQLTWPTQEDRGASDWIKL